MMLLYIKISDRIITITWVNLSTLILSLLRYIYRIDFEK
jgi:hypothetical protein